VIPTTARAATYVALCLLLVVAAVISLGVGAVAIAPAQVVRALLGNAAQASDATIIWDFRLPRILLVCVCGAALGGVGAGYQGLFRNPLADPSIIGASSGAALGATVALVLGGTGRAVLPLGLAGFVGALGAVWLVYLFAQAGGFGSLAALLLAGAAVSTMLSAVSSLVLLLNDQALPQVFGWLLGGFGGRSWPHLQQTLLLAPPGLLALWLMARPLDALMAGEESAHALGLDLRWARFVIVCGASLATAAAVAAAGIIGFVGLIAPHLARPLFGASHVHVIPASMLIGALLLLLADGLARTVLAPLEVPVGIFTAMLGGPFFLVLLRLRGRTK
jgi:iron complex transport system permease protein